MTNKPKKRVVPRSGEGVVVRLDPATPGQERARDLYDSSDVLFLLGPAGTGKTTLACGLALRDVLHGRFDELVVTRPALEAGERLGFMPGEMADKFGPYMAPVHDCLSRVAYKGPTAELPVEPVPLGFLRGRTFRRKVAVLDEAQNATWSQLTMFFTRLGEGGKLVFAGDPDQSDLPPGKNRLREFARALAGIPGLAVCTLDDADCCRHPVVKAALSRLRNHGQSRR